MVTNKKRNEMGENPRKMSFRTLARVTHTKSCWKTAFCQSVAICGRLWQCVAVFGHLWQSVTVYDSLWQSLAVYGSLWQSLALCGSLWQFVTVYDSLWQSVALSGTQWQCVAVFGHLWQFLQTDIHYQPERRRREGWPRTPHDPMLAFSWIFGIHKNS